MGTPWNGARLAGTVNGLARRLVRTDVPALADMTPESPFLQGLHADLPAVADRVTNIYSTHDGLIEPYVAAHIPVDGVTNILVATGDEYERHVRRFGLSHPVDELIEGRVSHLAEMSDPEIRSVVWRVVYELDRSL